jgi:hypothetical protein
VFLVADGVCLFFENSTVCQVFDAIWIRGRRFAGPLWSGVVVFAGFVLFWLHALVPASSGGGCDAMD